MSRGPDPILPDEEFSISGVGDMSLSFSFDLTEVIKPTLERKVCPKTNAYYFDRTDADDFVRAPHFILGIGLSIPTGSDDEMNGPSLIGAPYQPGAGVLRPLVSLSYSQDIGCVTPRASIAYNFSGGENDAGYEYADSVSMSISTFVSCIGNRNLVFFTGFSSLYQSDKDASFGVEVAGTSGTFNSFEFGFVTEPAQKMSIGLSFQFSVSSSTTDQPGAQDYRFSIGMSYRF